MCTDSAKVQLNNGILQRRLQDMPRALAHFERARELEPGYCEPDYWIGVTLVNTGEWLPWLQWLTNLFLSLHAKSDYFPIPMICELC